jgi:hypothetical protein
MNPDVQLHIGEPRRFRVRSERVHRAAHRADPPGTDEGASNPMLTNS